MLTAKGVEKLKPDPERRLEVPDGLVPGLFLVIQPSGAKSWALRYRAGQGRSGMPRKLTLGKWPILELGDARDRARELLQEIARGADPAGEKRQAKEEAAPAITTARGAAERFIRSQRAKGLRSADEQDRLLKLHVVGSEEKPTTLGRTDIRAVERRHVYALLEEMRDTRNEKGEPKYTAQVNRVLTLCKTFFGWAVEAGEIELNPAAEIKRMVTERSRERALTAEELVKVIRAADTEGYPVGPLVRLILLTGTRREEATQARWPEMDLEGEVWTIPAERTKAKREHRLPLSTAAVTLLSNLPRFKGGEYVFSASAGAKPYAGWRKAAGRLEKGAGLGADWIVHDLRRTVATRMGEDLDIDESIISRILNHSTKGRLGVTSIYERSRREKAMRAALESWGNHLLALLGEAEPAANVVALRG